MTNNQQIACQYFWQQGRSLWYISRLLGRTIPQVQAVCQSVERQKPLYDPHRPDWEPPTKKEQAFQLAQEGMKKDQIARTLGVSRATVYLWLRD